MSFWKKKSLKEMSRDEWESLCDHCGKCCLEKLEDEDDGSIYYTNIVCNLFDKRDGGCTDYSNRDTCVPTCLRLTQDNLEQIEWLPQSCAYRRVMDGRGLASWHHLVSGDKGMVHDTGNSVLGRVVYEKEVNEEALEEHIVTWPLRNA